MKTILCYGDSNTWGFMPFHEKPPVKANNRFPRDVRWTGLLQKELGEDYLVIEEGLNGRTTMFDCFMEERRNGLKEIDLCLLTHLPIDLVVLMLGTNDTKQAFAKSPYLIAQGMRRLAERVKSGGYGPNSAAPEVLMVAPARLNEGIFTSWLSDEFDADSLARDRALAQEYARAAADCGAHFLDAGAQISADNADGVHMNGEGHKAMAALICGKVREILVD